MDGAVIGREALAGYLAGVLGGDVEVLALRPLKPKDAEADDPKGFGYGIPFEVECTVGGVVRSLVVSRTRPAQGFGHDYPADRAWQALYGHAAYNSFLRHARSLDVGLVRASGELVSVSDAAEFFQLVEKVEGTLYWSDALVYLAKLLTESGVPVIIDATGHRRGWRDLARAVISNFAEVQLTCLIEVCRERERNRTAGNAPREIYASSERPGAAGPGVDVPYEPALDPEITIDTAAEEVSTAVAQIVPVALDLARFSPPRPLRRSNLGWAIWITGLPGSGKTTLASRVAERLAARGVPVRLLDVTEAQQLLPGLNGAPADAEIVYRALVCAAKLLTDAGVPVIIDATAPRRVWRGLARALIARYAEVQLVCPPEICGQREQAGRWHPIFCAQAGRQKTAGAVAPDIVLDYERSLNPELIVHTDVRDLWGATEEVLQLAHRLHRAP